MTFTFEVNRAGNEKEVVSVMTENRAGKTPQSVGMGSILFKMPFSDPSHSVKAFPTLDKGLPLGLVEKS